MDEDVIVLSDTSYESDSKSKSKNKNSSFENVGKNNSLESDLSDSQFPGVNFNKRRKDSARRNKAKEKEWSISDFPEVNFDSESILKLNDKAENKLNDVEFPQVDLDSKNDKNKKSAESDSHSDSDYESQNVDNDYWNQYMNGLKTKYQVDVNLSSDESQESLDKEVKNDKKKGKRTVKSKKVTDEEKKKKQEERQQEKLKKQEEIARQKALKQLNSKNRLNVNPEYNMKLMEITLDEKIENYDFFTNFLRATEETDLTYNVQSQLIPKSITWIRKVEEHYLNEKHEICCNKTTINEKQMIIIWNCEETVKHVSDDTFVSTISNVKSLVPDKKLSLIIYKIESYFKYLKSIKDHNMSNEILSGLGNAKQRKNKTKADKTFSSFPKISRRKFEDCLIEIQLMFNISSRLIENEAEMVLLIHQYTKSLALLPSKMEKRQESKLDWFATCDNRDTVKVDKDGNGLKRLWQQQLCQFSLTSLEISEAISAVYKSPLQLMEAYVNCTPAEGESLLKDIPIRRAAVPLTSVRKIGPELSKKIYIMFTSEDGDVYLNDNN